MTLPDSVYNINGFLSANEAELLYTLAAEVPANGTIVEIGSFQGKSTVALGLGAKQAGAWVYAIDPHEAQQINETVFYGMHNHAALLKNLVEFEVAETVRVIALPSQMIVEAWEADIDLLWIDGSHEYNDVFCDLVFWSLKVSINKIAIHDSSGHFPEVTKALNNFLREYPWKIVQTVDATTVLERVNV